MVLNGLDSWVEKVFNVVFLLIVINMKLIYAFLGVFWWIAIWGIFELHTADKTKEERMKIYTTILMCLLIVACIVPAFVDIISNVCDKK